MKQKQKSLLKGNTALLWAIIAILAIGVIAVIFAVNENGLVVLAKKTTTLKPKTITKTTAETNNCELLSGNGSKKNFKFMVLVEGQKNFSRNEIKSILKNSTIYYGYHTSYSQTLFPYESKINIYYSYLEEGALNCKIESTKTDGKDSNLMDCDRSKAKEIAKKLCGKFDEAIVIPLKLLSNASVRANTTPYDAEFNRLFVNYGKKIITLQFYDLIFDEDTAEDYRSADVALSNLSSSTFWHELGHSFGGNPDYHVLPEVKNNPCWPNLYCACSKARLNSKMCNPTIDFLTNGKGNSEKSADAWRMVKRLNERCLARVHAQEKHWNAFPNPVGKGEEIKLPYAIEIKTNEFGKKEYCQVYAEIYNTKGQIIRVYTTEQAPDGISYMAKMKDGKKYNYFAWNQKNQEGTQVASGVYYAKVCAGNCIEYKFTIIG